MAKRTRYNVVVDGNRYQTLAMNSEEAIAQAVTENGIAKYDKATARPAKRKTSAASITKARQAVAKAEEKLARAVIESNPRYLELIERLDDIRAFRRELREMDTADLSPLDKLEYDVVCKRARLDELNAKADIVKFKQAVIDHAKACKDKDGEKEPAPTSKLNASVSSSYTTIY